MDKRIEKGEITREHILLKAVEMIATGGISSLSAAKLAETCNLSKSNVFHHFKNVDAILMAVAQLVMEQTESGLEVQGTNVRDYLEKIAGSLLEVSEAEKLLFRAYFAVYNHGLFNVGYNALIKDQTTRLVAVLGNKLSTLAIKEWHLDGDDLLKERCRWCAVHFLAFMDGLGLQALLMDSSSNETYQRAIHMEIALIEQVLREA